MQKSTDRFLDREVSALEFNARVLAEGKDISNPLLERLKFMGIVSSNLDEFFMVRIASLNPKEASWKTVVDRAQSLIADLAQTFANDLVPKLEAAGLTRLTPESASPMQIEYVRQFFQNELFPVLTPIALSDERPFPVLANLRLHVAVSLKAGSGTKIAVIEIPQNFSRVVFLPKEKEHPYMLIEDVVAAFATELFQGFEIEERLLFRITRGAEMTWSEEGDEDFMKVMSDALRQRRQGAVMRLEVSARNPLTTFFMKHLAVKEETVVDVGRWMDLKSFSSLAFQPGFDELKRPTWVPKPSAELDLEASFWDQIRKRDALLFHPYESFEAVSRFVSGAADDPDVLAIKQTLYRTGSDSSLTRSLVRAAEKGKQVTVLIELKARFDEENNIEWAKRLQDAGATVLYGVVGLKTHAKVCVVVRRESDGIRRYVHLSTGNYNEKTARLYSDIGLFTADDAMANDALAFFNMITGYSQPTVWAKMAVAPYGLRKKVLRLIRREAQRHTAQKPGLIMAKMNSLSDPEMIDALYAASKAGVPIRLNVRGICCLKPGVKNMSETIEVVSIVDQFLEHSRIFYFENGGDEEIYLSSADWMGRNLDRRVETFFPVDAPDTQKKLIDHLKLYFRDNVKSWKLLPSGSYERIDAAGKRRFRVQEALCQRAESASLEKQKAIPLELTPQRPAAS